MKRVLILANNDVGLYNFRKELIRELLKQKHEVFISLPHGSKVNKLEKLGCKFIETKLDRRGTNPITDIKLFIKYISILNNIRPHVVLTYTVKPNLYGGIACRLKGIPYICNVTGLGSGFLNKGLTQSVIKTLSKRSFTTAQCVMVQNSADMEILKQSKTIKGNGRLIPGSGVNLSEYEVLPYPKEDSPIQFNFIARIMKDKGIDEYLEAAKIIKAKYPEIIFNVIGDIEQENYRVILEEYTNKKIINYKGFQSNIKMVIEESHCTINPSYTEGMSNVLLESAACGRPIIASNIPGCREILSEGISGYTFKVKESSHLVEQIERFIRLPYQSKVQMGVEGRKKIEKMFDRQIIINEYIEEIKKS